MHRSKLFMPPLPIRRPNQGRKSSHRPTSHKTGFEFPAFLAGGGVPFTVSTNQIKQPSLAPALPIQITVHHCLSRNLQHDFPPAHFYLLRRPDNAGYAHYLPGIAFHQPATQPRIEGDEVGGQLDSWQVAAAVRGYFPIDSVFRLLAIA